MHQCDISATYQGYWYIIKAMQLLEENRMRLTAVTKEIYMEIAFQMRKSWKSIERDMRFVVNKAWMNNPAYVEEIAGRKLNSAPSVSLFLEILLMYANRENE